MTRMVLVTGGAGFVGSALVRRLVETGAKVRVLDDLSRGRPQRIADLDVELVHGDVRDRIAVESACSGVGAVWHLASVNGTESFYSKPDVVLEVGVKGILNVIDAMRRHDVSELFVASSSEVYQTPPGVPTDERVPLTIPDPLNARYSYAGAKLISELLALNFGRRHLHRVVVFRPHNVYGPDMGWEHVIPQLTVRLRELRRTTSGRVRLPIQGTGAETRAFVHIADAIDGLLCLARGGEHMSIYNVGNDVETRIDDLARKIGHCLAREVEVVPGVAPPGATPRRCPDISRLRALGYRPRVSLSDGLATTVRWYVEHDPELQVSLR